MFEINGLFKLASKYNPNTGCDDPRDADYIDISFSDEDPIDLVKKVADFLGCEDYDIEPLDDEVGRVDFTMLENSDGTVANEWEINKWKKGDLTLYLCDYTGYVEEVDRRAFSFADMPKTYDEMYG